VSFWQLESDASFPGHTFAGFGRYGLFEILDATPTFRVLLNLTTSPTQPPTGSYRLPPASVTGAETARFPLVGSGSARVISPPVRARMIAGRPYLLIDMGRQGQFPVVPRVGITGLWGTATLLDSRRLTSYVRDVSLISERQYDQLVPPRAISRFPHDLGDPGLEYSGIFEDGWVGKDSYVRISGAPGHFVVRANVLAQAQVQHLRVIINGLTVWSHDVKPGPLSVGFPLTRSSGPRRVELSFTHASRLSAQDRRTAAAQLTYVGVE
jgi:hypothetical protein